MNKTLLIIGAGREQISAYQIAKKMGLNVVGTDIDPKAPCFQFSDYQLICSTRDPKETLSEVLRYSKNHSIHGIITVANDVPYTVSIVAKKLGLRSISPKSARLVTNKHLMKKLFLNKKIPTPDFKILKKKSDFFKSIDNKNFPYIIKPSDSRGSRGVLFLDKTINLNWAWKHSLANSENKIILLEKFEPGDQINVEGYFHKKKYHAVAFSDRNYTNLTKTKPYIVEDGGVIPSKYSGKTLREISDLVERAAKSLGITWGTVKADIIMTNEGPKIIELAARLSGNYLATHQIPWVYGFDIVGTIIKMSLGIRMNPKFVTKPKRFLGIRYFFPKSGKIKKIQYIEKIKALKCVKMLEIFHKQGDFQPVIINHPARAGVLICEGRNYLDAINKVDTCRNKIKFVIN